MTVLDELGHENLSNKVYITLCNALISGQFQPGDRLKVRDLAEQLGTSVTPVRDAILRLTHDKAVVFRSARDIRIPVMTKEQYLEIRTIRLKLEALAAKAAAEMATNRDIADMEQLLQKNEATFEAKDRLSSAELNQAFHFMLPKIAEMPVLDCIMRRLWLQMGPLMAETYFENGRSIIDHHYLVLEALKRRDPHAAIEAIQDDIRHGGKGLLLKVQSRSQGRNKE